MIRAYSIRKEHGPRAPNTIFDCSLLNNHSKLTSWLHFTINSITSETTNAVMVNCQSLQFCNRNWIIELSAFPVFSKCIRFRDFHYRHYTDIINLEHRWSILAGLSRQSTLFFLAFLIKSKARDMTIVMSPAWFKHSLANYAATQVSANELHAQYKGRKHTIKPGFY